jgi:hypothetical protein
MKLLGTAAIAILLLAGCSSSTDLIETESVLCAEMGNEVSVMLYAAETDKIPAGIGSDQGVTLRVEVSNNSDRDIVVKSIVLVPTDPRARIRLNTAYGKFDQVIAEGKDHVFPLRTTGRWHNPDITGRDQPAGSVELESRVTLGNGQTYRCRFEVPLY